MLGLVADTRICKSIGNSNSKRGSCNESYTTDRQSASVTLHLSVPADLLHALSAKWRATHTEYCSGSRRVGRWFWLERCVRHSCEGRLQRQHRSRAGDVF